MSAPATRFCPLFRGYLWTPDAVRTHLITDHKRSAAEADELIARFGTPRPIFEVEPKPHMYCAVAQPGNGGRSGHNGAAAPEMLVD